MGINRLCLTVIYTTVDSRIIELGHLSNAIDTLDPTRQCVVFQIFPFVATHCLNNHMKDWHKRYRYSGLGKQMPQLLEFIYLHELQEKTVLDFGCGKGGTMSWLQGLYPNITVKGWDIGTQKYRRRPRDTQFDAIYSIDCLEHIERADLPDAIVNLKRISGPGCAWCHIIDMTPAKKLLPDGRNCHVTLMTATEWQAQFEAWDCSVMQMRVFKQPDPNFGVRSRCVIHCRP